MPGKFVISLDFELMWGVRDHATKEQYGARVLGERQGVPAMLDLFAANGVHATWATVGFLFCDGRDELLARAPQETPTYKNPSLSNYAYLDEVGDSEADDPYYFAPSMLRQVLQCPGQELGTHTMSHYYCLEAGQTDAQFRADLKASIALMRDWSLDCRSIVFPRNQYAERHLAICAAEGLEVFRGNGPAWMYASEAGDKQTAWRRGARLIDAYVSISGPNTACAEQNEGLVNVPASRFLRPYNRRLAVLDRLRLRRITAAMTHAARNGEIFHLWWHPHNFGLDTAENIAVLSAIVGEYRRLADRYGMTSVTMTEAAVD